ncbi:beta-glucosidase family protein [Thermomonospora umbrina]|uniref:Beta-glucosidase n=1 Tax=Thermomonospora umbrina TaxID=111806 RepID=A0A3D9SLJ7_9ACTN|nr:glycoside hydrolase family 3 C-terminal domain-containing protein [Thermomonospora umbrina]REE96802.1 beta-glucosidase [Thermomonospora umbrina]
MLRRRSHLALAVVAGLTAALAAVVPAQAIDEPWMNTSLSPDERADLLLATLDDKQRRQLLAGSQVCDTASLLGDGYVPPRGAVPAQEMIGAGAGVTNVCKRLGHPERQATSLPAPIAMAATWDTNAARTHGTVIGAETRAFGFNVGLTSHSNIIRDPRNGRTWENQGEDPLLAGIMTSAQLAGLQSQKVVATHKNIVGNENERYRQGQNSIIDERTLREIYLRPFEISIQKANPGALMCSYNMINGSPACQAPAVMDIVKNEWGFPGWIMTDWWTCMGQGVYTDSGGNDHAVPYPTNTCGTQQSIQAGLDQQMPNGTFYGEGLLWSALASGLITQGQIDAAAHRILRSMFANGVIDDPPTPGTPSAAQIAAHATTSRQLAEQAAVLLRNEQNILPLSKTTGGTIALIGSPADADPAASGPNGSGYVVPYASQIAKARQKIEDATGRTVTYVDGTNKAAAVSLAANADTVIVFGRDSQQEGADKKNLTLDPFGTQPADDLISSVAAANPDTVVVLQTGGPVTMPWRNSVKGILEAWYPGEQGGAAIANLLFGDANPSGRLPVTFPVDEQHMPTPATGWQGTPTTLNYTEGLNVGYRWYDQNSAPLYPFGHGLSYGGNFAYSGLGLSSTTVPQPNPVSDNHQLSNVTLTLTNNGTRTASETAQVYVGFPAGTGEPPKRLVGWKKVTLGPGQSTQVTIPLDDRSLAIWNTTTDSWQVPCGNYPVHAASSAGSIRQTATLKVC